MYLKGFKYVYLKGFQFLYLNPRPASGIGRLKCSELTRELFQGVMITHHAKADKNNVTLFLIPDGFVFIPRCFFFFFFTLGTGPRRSLSLKLGDARVYAPQIRARLGTTAHFCELVVLKPREGFVFIPRCAHDERW